VSDVLAQEPQRSPTWVWVVGALVAAVVVGLAIDRAARPASTAALPSPTPSASASVSALADPETAVSACGDVDLPLVNAAALPDRTGIRLLVGDRDLRLVDVDAGTTSVLTAPAQLGRQQAVTGLSRTDGLLLAVLNGACGAGGLGSGRIVEVDPSTGRVSPAGPGDEILPGAPATALEYDAPTNRWQVRRLAGGTRTPLASDAPFPLAAAGSSYVMAVNGADGAAPTIGLGNVATGKLTRPFGTGSPVAASSHGVFWAAGECSAGRCLLAHTGLDGVTAAQPVRADPCCGVISPDGRWLAFRLPRVSGRFGAHPGPPSEIAVLDSRTGSLRVLPGLVLPAKAATTFAWSADSRWLAIGADAGTEPLILLWHEGMERPALVPVQPTSGGTAGAPALVVL
jgi:hypothetical protein